MDKINIQQTDFDLTTELNLVKKSSQNIGAIVNFVGVVRDLDEQKIIKITLEHYQKMSEKSLQSIINQARKRWDLGNVTIIHRVGELKLGEQIVLVITSSKHRKSAFCSCEFIIDYLKTQAPFWKKEHTQNSQYWVQKNNADTEKIKQWSA